MISPVKITGSMLSGVTPYLSNSQVVVAGSCAKPWLGNARERIFLTAEKVIEL